MKKLLILLLFNAIANANAIKDLDVFLMNKTVYAKFKQIVFGHKKNHISEGIMQISRPNKFRWEYVSEGQLIVSNGNKIYIFDKPLKQLTVKNFALGLGKSPAAILAGGIDSKNIYNIILMGDSKNLEWVRLVPKKIDDNNGFNQVDIGFEKNNQHLIKQMNFLDVYGNKSIIIFSDVIVNSEIQNSSFSFKIESSFDVLKDK